MIKVVLINPPVFSVVEPWYDTPEYTRPGLACLAAYLRKDDDIYVRIIDAKFERLSFAAVLERISEIRPDIVGLTAFTNEIKAAARQAEVIKKRFPRVLTVIGGVHLTALPLLTLSEFPQFDIGVAGEGEGVFSELCSAVKNNCSYESIPCLVYRREEKIVDAGLAPKLLKPSSIPTPAWDLLPRAGKYIVTSLRGCPFSCPFCMNPNGRRVRQREIVDVIEELKMIIKKYRPRDIIFSDETFSVDMNRTHRLLDAMISEGMERNVRFECWSHVRFVDEQLLKKMKRAGFYRIGLGVETGDEDKQKKLKKGIDNETIFMARLAAKRADIKISCYFIIGQPNETVCSINDTIDLAVRLNPDLPVFGTMVPYPATEVSHMAALGEAGYKLVSADWNEYNKQVGGVLEFAGLNHSQIEWTRIKGYVKVFLWNWRIFDFLAFAWNYRGGIISVFKRLLLKKPGEVALVPREEFVYAWKKWQEWLQQSR